MPNHVTTRMKITDLGDAELVDVQGTFLNEKREVDFNVIAPMPDCLKDFSPHSGIINRAEMALGLLNEPGDGEGLAALTSRLHFSNCLRDATNEIRKEDIGQVVRAISNYDDCGYIYWYEWSNDHWGTKWNAYSQPEGGFAEDATEFEFETAWSHPSNLIVEMSARNPGVTFHVEFADEDTGSNCGRYVICSGLISSSETAPRYSEQTEAQKKHFTEMAYRIRYGDEDPRAHGYDENWQYSEEIYESYEQDQANA